MQKGFGIKICQKQFWQIACGLLFGLIANSAYANSFNIGPYRLGMTNAEAAKIHLSDCKTMLKTIVECKGTVRVLNETRRLTLQFSTRTKKLDHMELIVWQKWKDETVESQIRKDLNIPICHPNMTPDQGETCYKKPRSVQFVRFTPDWGYHRRTGGNNAHYTINAVSGSSNADYFFREIPKLKAREEMVKKFQNGQ
jgi:hypothetical protein